MKPLHDTELISLVGEYYVLYKLAQHRGENSYKYKELWLPLLEFNSNTLNEIKNSEKRLRLEKLAIPENTLSTTQVAAMFNLPSNYIIDYCKKKLIEYIPYNKRKGKPVYRITQKGLNDLKVILKMKNNPSLYI